MIVCLPKVWLQLRVFDHRRKALSKSAEESEWLTGGPGAISNCEKGVAKAGRKGNADVDYLRPGASTQRSRP